MEKMNLLNSYKSARSSLLSAIIFSVLNCFMLYFNMDYYFLYSMITPRLAIAFSKYVFRGFSSLMIIVMFAIVPLVLYIISYLLSEKDWKWLRVGTILFASDIVVFIGFFLIYGFEPSYIIDIVFEAVIMFILVKGVLAGKELNNDFEVEEIVFEKPVEEGELVEGEVVESDQSNAVRVYKYDRELAKNNKTNKTLLVVGSFVATMGLLTVLMVVLNKTLNTHPMLMVVIIYGILIVYIVWVVKLSPFLYAKNYTFFKKDGVVYRTLTTSGYIQGFEDVFVEGVSEDRYVCSYKHKTGKRKELIIPKCYRGIEDILDINTGNEI